MDALLGSFDGDPYDYVLSANLHRRHLTSEQKRELIAKILKAKPETSNRKIAKQTKADDKTVAKVRRKLESTSEIPRLEKTTGADGRQRKARPKKPPKPVDRRVTESPQISLEQRRAENGEPDLSAEERAAKASASALAEFTVACRAWLPKVTVEADRQRVTGGDIDVLEAQGGCVMCSHCADCSRASASAASARPKVDARPGQRTRGNAA
jgi:hypothetical protein